MAVLRRLHRWAAGRQGIVIVEGTWQDALPMLGRFDALFFDDFPLPTDSGRREHRRKRRRLVLPPPRHGSGGAAPHTGCRRPGVVGHSSGERPKPTTLPPTRTTDATACRPVVRQGHPLAHSDGVRFVADGSLAALDTRWTVIVNLCADWHMRPGARLTGYLARQCSISHPDCAVTITKFRVTPPTHCPYFCGTHLFVPQITLRGRAACGGV